MKMIWVKDHSGVFRNNEANKLAAKSTKIDIPPDTQIPTTPANTIPSCVKLSTLSQRDFYHAIKTANQPPTQRRLTNTTGRIQACTKAAYNTTPTPKVICRLVRHKDLTKNTQEFLWKCFHNTFKIGQFWENITNFEHRGICAHCNTEELMEHILIKCTAPGRTEIWILANELWKKRSHVLIPSNYSALLGCCLSNFKKPNNNSNNNKKPNKGLNRLFRIILSESMYMIWKLRCERTISWGDNPSKYHSPHKIHSEWLQAINSRLRTDSVQKNTKIFKKKPISAKTVLKTWKNCLKDNLHETRNWCEGILRVAENRNSFDTTQGREE